MAIVNVQPRSLWACYRVTLGNLGIATVITIGPEIRQLLIVSEATAIWVSDYPTPEGNVIPANEYAIIPANNALRIPVVSDVTTTPHLENLTRLVIAGAANAATVCIVGEVGEAGNR